MVASDLSSTDAIEAAGAGIWRWEIPHQQVRLSPIAAKLLETSLAVVSLDEFIGLIHPYDRRVLERAMQDCASIRRPIDLDLRVLNGEWRRIRGQSDSEGKTATGILFDIGARRSAQIANSRLAAIVSSSDDAIVGKTIDGIVTDWNRGAQMIFGYAAEEIIGKPIGLLLPPGLESEEDAILERIRRGEKVDHFETRRRCKNGSIIDVSATISPLYDDEGKLVGASKVARDITASKQAQQRLEDLQNELIFISRFTALGEMASTLAHELNQPLLAIASYLSGARKYLGKIEAAEELSMMRQAIDGAEEQALRAGQIIRRLREFFSRGESDRRVENLQLLIEEACALAVVGAKENGTRVSFSFENHPQLVMVDKIQIQQVILNLVRNALEALQEVERRNLTIATKTMDTESVEVAVIDSGPGIAREIEARLFEPFMTTKRHGMGVGLSISRTIVEAHGGKLWAEPNPEGGTIFRMTLKTTQWDRCLQS